MKRSCIRSTLMSLALGLFAAFSATAAPDDDAVISRVEAFRSAQFAADRDALLSLSAPELSYSHSDGRVEDQSTFAKNATAGKTKFVALEYRSLSVRVVGNAAIVRFNWIGQQETLATGAKTDTNLHILMVWIKQGESWRLLARSATKL